MPDRYAHLSDTTMREAAGTVAQLVAHGHKVVTKVKKARSTKKTMARASA